MRNVHLEVVVVAHAAHIKRLLISFAGDAVLHSRPDDHLVTPHVVEHHVVEVRHQSVEVHDVEVYLLISNYLNPDIPFDEVEEAPNVQAIVLSPLLLFRIFLVSHYFKEEDGARAASD